MLQNFWLWLAIIILALAPAPTQAQSAPACENESATSAGETLDQLQARAPAFHASVPHRGASQVWWCRLRLGPRSVGSYITVSEDGNEVALWAPSAAGTYVQHRSGTAVPMAQREIKVPGAAFPVQYPGTYYLRIASEWPATISIISKAEFDAARGDERVRYGFILFYIGLLTAICVYHLAQFALARTRDSLFYAIYLVALIVDEFAFGSGFGWMFVWPNASVTLEVAQDLFINTFVLVSFYAFLRSFLNTRRATPVLDRAMLAIMLLYGATNAVFYVGHMDDLGSARGWLGLYEYPALQLFGITVAFVAARRGNRSAWYVVIACSAFLVGSTLSSYVQLIGNFLHRDLSQTPFITFGESYFYEMGAGLEALLLSLALADRVRTANREREAAQDRLISGLRAYNEAVDRFVPRAFLDQLGRPTVVDVRLGDHVQGAMTVLFSDIRGFSTISEKLEPEAIFALLNDYLGRASPQIAQCNGFIDKYVGDAIMALFAGRADDALAAGIALHRIAAEMEGAYPLRIGVGIHHGSLILGTIGEPSRMETTVIADAVNVASRVEGLTKDLCAPMLITDATKAALQEPERWLLRYLGTQPVKGKAITVGIHEVVMPQSEGALLRQTTLLEFEQGVTALTRGSLEEARAAFQDVLRRDPTDSTAAVLLKRAASAEATRGGSL